LTDVGPFGPYPRAPLFRGIWILLFEGLAAADTIPGDGSRWLVRDLEQYSTEGTVDAVYLSLSICAAALGLQPVENIAHERVDLIEINHYHDQHGKLVLDQIIFYQWSAEESRFQVRDWRPLKSSNQLPRPDWRRRDWVAVWRDGHLLRKVRSPAVRETWTLYDPEVLDRELLPKEQRRRLGTSITVALTTSDLKRMR